MDVPYYDAFLFLKVFLLIWPNFFWHQISEELLLTDAWEDFPNQSMGLTEIEGVNEKEEMHITDVRIWNSKVLYFVHPIFRFWFLVIFGDEVTKIRKY